MKNLLFVLIAMLGISGVPAPVGCLNADILIVSDWSGSLSGNEKFLIDAQRTFVEGLDLRDKGVRIGIVGFREDVFIDSYFSDNKDDLRHVLRAAEKRRAGDGTNFSNAFYASTLMFMESRPDVQKVCIFISDGMPNDAYEIYGIHIESLKAMDVKIFCINPNGDRTGKGVLEAIASSQDMYISTNYQALMLILQELQICG